jgi:dephospho-CoA kinase
MLSLGLTGGIASGKTLAARFFADKGALVLDADAEARQVVLPGSAGLARIVEAFGAGMLTPEGMLDREKMAAVVFADPAQRKLLDGILHPLILGAMFAKADGLRTGGHAGIVVLDIPLLFECNLQARFDKTVLVYADEELQIARLMERNGLSESQARQRLAAQMPIERKRALADFVIENTGSQEALAAAVARVWGAVAEINAAAK